jgi:PIN domain nuclease of toxin-antitoxin system
VTSRPYSAVLDASAYLAVVHDEPGADIVLSHLDTGLISAVNWAEVLGRLIDRGFSLDPVIEDMEQSGVTVVPFALASADSSARLLPLTRSLGLSLGDRACLSLAQEYGVPALTADRQWAQLEAPIQVQLIR